MSFLASLAAVGVTGCVGRDESPRRFGRVFAGVYQASSVVAYLGPPVLAIEAERRKLGEIDALAASTEPEGHVIVQSLAAK